MRAVKWWPADGGAAVELTGPRRAAGFTLAKGAKGLGVPPVEWESEDIAGADGEWQTGARYGARPVELPCLVAGRDRDDYRARLAELEAAMSVHDGPGELEVIENGTGRRLRCLYVGGLEGDEERGAHTGRMWRTILSFHAFDPYWRDAAPTVESWQIADPVPFLGSPFLPLRLSASSTFGNIALTNDGHGDAWPVWTITGPASNVKLRNRSTGAVIELTDGIAAGRTATIVTEPGISDVTATAPTESYWSHISPASDMWPIRAGRNLIAVDMIGATAATRVQIAYVRRFRSAT